MRRIEAERARIQNDVAYRNELMNFQMVELAKKVEAHRKEMAALEVERRNTSYYAVRSVFDSNGSLEYAVIKGPKNKEIKISRDELMQRAKDGDILCCMVMEKIAIDKMLSQSIVQGEDGTMTSVDTRNMSYKQVKEYFNGQK